MTAGRHGRAAELWPCGDIAAWTHGFGVCMQTWTRVKEDIDIERASEKIVYLENTTTSAGCCYAFFLRIERLQQLMPREQQRVTG